MRERGCREREKSQERITDFQAEKNPNEQRSLKICSFRWWEKPIAG